MDTPPFDPWQEEPEPEGRPEAALPEDSELLPTIVCWRCGKDVSAEISRCPFCRATLTAEPEAASQRALLDPRAQSLTRLFGIFAAMLGISVVAGLDPASCRHVHAASGCQSRGEMLAIVVFLEALDTVVDSGGLGVGRHDVSRAQPIGIVAVCRLGCWPCRCWRWRCC